MGGPVAVRVASVGRVTVLVDTSVLIDYLRGDVRAAAVLERGREVAPLHASEITRLKVLAGMGLRRSPPPARCCRLWCGIRLRPR